MKQYCNLDETIKKQVMSLENTCEQACSALQNQYQPLLNKTGRKLIIELIRSVKGRHAEQYQVFDENYESNIEIGIEYEGDYYPNGYIPLWKCKNEWFEKTGYLTSRSYEEIKKHLEAILLEILEEEANIERN